MSHLYKEWHDIVREYTKEQQAFIDTHERYHEIYARLTEERKRLNKEYALQLSNSVGQNNGEKQNDK
jgi:hypothetical protein